MERLPNNENENGNVDRKLLIGLVVGAVVVAGLVYVAEHPQNGKAIAPQESAKPRPNSTLSIGKRTQTTGCHAEGGLPDKACTPGAIIGSVTTAQICKPGYASSVRNVSGSTKHVVYQEYGIASHKSGQYEVDHLVSLELGGSNEIANLWPEAAEPRPGFHEKDRVENYLHTQVCTGKITLHAAQVEEANNWLAIYHQIS